MVDVLHAVLHRYEGQFLGASLKTAHHPLPMYQVAPVKFPPAKLGFSHLSRGGRPISLGVVTVTEVDPHLSAEDRL